ncbi:MAG: serine hydrolase [Gemmatimonadaceae bacterium]
MMTRILTHIGLLAAVSCAQRTLGAQDTTYRFDAARRVIDSLMRQHGVPSIAVAVAKDGRIVWEEGFGFANREKQIRATPASAYSLASISKPFTATGLMKLVERKRVDLDRPVNEYLGAAKLRAHEGQASAATVRHVLTHTAGLPLHYQFFYADGGYRPPTTDETIRRFGILVYRPGSGYQYSNLGFGLLDYVIRRQSGLSYGEYMRREVFGPLGLTHTSVGPRSALKEETAERYGADGRPVPYYTFDHPGASEVYSSAHDLVRFGMFHLGNGLAEQEQILTRQTREAMQRDVAVEGPGATRGLGWGIRSDEFGWRRVSHSGGMPGVSTALNLYPAANVAIVVLLNKSVPQVTGRIAQEIAAAILPGYEGRLREALARPSASPSSPDWTTFIGRWRGYVRSYRDSVAVQFTVDSSGPRDLRVGAETAERPVSANWSNGLLTVVTRASLTAPDIARHPHVLGFTLRLRGDTLSGYAAATTNAPPASRVYYALSSYARVTRVRERGAAALPPGLGRASGDGARTRVVMLGTGTPNADPDRSGPAVAVVVHDRAYLVDAGPGVVRRAAAAQRAGVGALAANRLERVFLTHLHSDHTLGLPDLLLSPWVLERTVPLRIFGPPGTEKMMSHISAAWTEDIRNRIDGLEPANETGYRTQVEIVEPGVVYRDELVTVRAFSVPHGDWQRAYGYRFETPDRVVVISGDAQPSEATADACNGCDILVHEVYSAERFVTRPPEWQRYHARAHTSTRELAALAQKARPGMLLLYHQLYWGSSDADLLREVRAAGYTGRLASARDLGVY